MLYYVEADLLSFSIFSVFLGLLTSMVGGILDVICNCTKYLKHGCIINCGRTAGSLCF
jgi:hypothetical protein